MDQQMVDMVPGSASHGVNCLSALATSQASLTCFESVTLLLGWTKSAYSFIFYLLSFQLQNKAKKLFLTEEPLKLSPENVPI